MRFGIALLLILVFVLASLGCYTVLQFRSVVHEVTWRTKVFPIAAGLSGSVSEMRVIVGEFRGIRRTRSRFPTIEKNDYGLHRQFQMKLDVFKSGYASYETELQKRGKTDGRYEEEWKSLNTIKLNLAPIELLVNDTYEWGNNDDSLNQMNGYLTQLAPLVDKLPNYLNVNMVAYTDTIRRYSIWLNVILITSIGLSALLLTLFLFLLYCWIFRPLRQLIDGSRLVAAGTFQYRITLTSNDEIAELAGAMNNMTERFEKIRDDLDRQVQVRTQEVVRKEQLASVGFLAAGVAHEINNPLASIAMAAESLRQRLITDGEHGQTEVKIEDAKLVERLLRMIEDEAFRCKGITEKLLNLARVGNKRREKCDIVIIVDDLIEMLRQHGTYKEKKLSVEKPMLLYVDINAQEIKQVLLNLMVNSLDFIPPDGEVRVVVKQVEDQAVVDVIDNGIGMSADVLRNVFEPFFTSRPQGGGTGLGLSISHRIITDHGGKLEAFSEGQSKGSTFRMTLPMN
jgi:signal transduction histidine kinase